jgi:drug/metabolite transporter (DMT)-like permease
MSILVFLHVVTGLLGIAAGLVVVVGAFCRRTLARWNALFLSTTAAACATGFAYFPIDGMTSAQAVALFTAALLVVAAYARYARRLGGGWSQVYVGSAVAALFLNVLIATTQSFQHVRTLQALAPTQRSPLYVSLKVALLAVFIALAIVLVRREGRRTDN